MTRRKLQRSRYGTASHFRKDKTLKRPKKEREEVDGIYPFAEELDFPDATNGIYEPETPYPGDWVTLTRAPRIFLRGGAMRHKGLPQPPQKKNIENFLTTPEQRALWSAYNVARGKKPYKIWIRKHQRAKRALIKSGVPAELIVLRIQK